MENVYVFWPRKSKICSQTYPRKPHTPKATKVPACSGRSRLNGLLCQLPGKQNLLFPNESGCPDTHGAEAFPNRRAYSPDRELPTLCRGGPHACCMGPPRSCAPNSIKELMCAPRTRSCMCSYQILIYMAQHMHTFFTPFMPFPHVHPYPH